MRLAAPRALSRHGSLAGMHLQTLCVSAIYHPRGQKLHLARRAEVDTELEMSGGEAASEDLRALLVTHNVCGVFDQMESALPFWVQELQALVREQSADFVALHMQEFT